MKACIHCGSTEMDQRLSAHHLCEARKRLGMQTPRNVPAVPVECKVIQDQLFEKIKGKWTKILG